MIVLNTYVFPLLTVLDLAAVGIFLFCYVAYIWIGHYPPAGRTSLRQAMHLWRRRWMQSLTCRESRITDTQLLGHIMRSVTFFASTSVLILAGLAAAFGTAEQTAHALSRIPFVMPITGDQFALRLLLTMAFVVYAFFVWTMGLRQFNYACVVIGALSNVPDSQEQQDFVNDAADVLGLATNSFNAGMRSYYFALASMGWFLHPIVLMAFAIGVFLLLYYRQMHSTTVKALLRHQRPEEMNK